VGHLALALDASEDAVGYGLRILRTAGMVTGRKEGEPCATGWPQAYRSRFAAGAYLP
jgi:DNA-binding transcriptional ArsR family regulator